MASLASINIRFKADLKRFSTEMQTALRELDKAGQKFQQIGRTLSVGLTLPIVAAGGAAIKFASDYEESLNKVDVAFKSSSGQVKTFAKDTLQNFGIAEGTALDLASAYGDMGTSLGLTTGEAAKMSTSLVGLAGDLSSFKNISIDIANTALSGIFTGETESLKKLGIVMTEAALQQYAYNQGIQKSVQDMGMAEKVQLRYNYILSVTKNAQGDFARTQGGAANQMRIFQESLKQLAQQFGSIILPAFTSIVNGLNGMIASFGKLSESSKTTIIIIAGIAAAIGPLFLAIGAISSLIPTLITGFTVLTGPIGLVVAGLAAVAYVVATNWPIVKKTLVDVANYFIDLYNQSTLFRGAVEGIAAVFKNTWAVVKLIFNNIVAAAKFTVSSIFNYFSTVGNLIKGVLTFDIDLIKDSLKKGFGAAKDDSLKFLKTVGTNSKTTAQEIGTNIATAVKNTLSGKGIKKIVIPKEKVDAKGVETAIEEAGSAGGGKAAKAVKKSLDEIKSFLQAPISQGSIASYDAQIAELQKFRNEVATTAAQVKLADDAIKKIELAKSLKFDPTSLITISGGFAKMVDEIQAKANGMKSSLDASKAVVVDFGTVVGESIRQLAADAAVGFGETLGAVISGSEGIGAIFSGLLGMVANFMKDLGKSLIQIAVANIALKKAFANPFVALAAGIALVALGSAFQSKMSDGPQRFENGGIVGGTSFYGDKILARVNSGELILNQKQQAAVYGRMNSSGDSGLSFAASTKIQGSDLLVILERAEKKKSRLG